MKNNLVFFNKVVVFFGVCVYSIFFTISLNASSYSWECKKNSSYLIEEKELIDLKDRFKEFPTKFISNLDEKVKDISLTYDLGTGIAIINGKKGIITGFPKANKSFKEMPLKSLVISSYSMSSKENLNTIFEEYKKKIEGSFTNEVKINNFLLNTQIDTANFVSIETNEISKKLFLLKKNLPTKTLDIEKLIEISIGKCRLLSKG